MNKRHRSILKQARELIKSRREQQFLCVAIQCTAGRTKDKEYLIKYIDKKLHPHGTLDSWLMWNNLPAYNKGTLRKYRLQWIDWMLNGD